MNFFAMTKTSRPIRDGILFIWNKTIVLKIKTFRIYRGYMCRECGLQRWSPKDLEKDRKFTFRINEIVWT